MRHPEDSDEVKDRAAAYALGALAPVAAQTFEEHLRGGCATCAAEVREFARVAAQLAWSAPEIAPPERVRTQLLARIAASAAPPETISDAGAKLSPTTDAAEFFIVRADEGEWMETADAGVFVKLLFVDKERDLVTTLVRMQPGSCVPAHRHLGIEQCLVVEGDLKSAGHVLRAGDYNRAATGSVHQDLTTERGALLLIVAPESYELIRPPAAAGLA